VLEKELQEVKSLLVKQEEDLKKLRKENSKTFVIALIIMFFAFLTYGIYQMMTNG
jgi:predicted negative regulator of RcsB-dependent stress response